MRDENEVLVSVCCLTYNHAPFIRECIEGFLMQKTTFSIEIIIHDDASTDGTASIIKEYADKNPDLFVTILQKENQWSKGIRPSPTFVWPRARGKYIALCEGDDYWIDACKLQKQVDFLEANPTYSYCFTDRMVIDEKGELIKKTTMPDRFKEKIKAEDIIGGFTPYTQTVVFNKEHINKALFDVIENVFNGDLVLFTYLSLKGKIGYLDFVSSAYRIHDGGIRSKKIIIDAHLLRIITLTNMKSIIPSEYFKFFRKRFTVTYQRLFVSAIFEKKYSLIFNSLFHLIKNDIKYIDYSTFRAIKLLLKSKSPSGAAQKL